MEKKIGKPSYIGTTIEGFQFYRYEDKHIEIYFSGNRVVGWNDLYFRP
ncbi:MAG: hypothetical protein JW734_03845 [Candidatus Omnitrophica bacterium]|nr:hypothetical protein [Candidatus Omnitrophota bacterium]